MSWKHSGQRQSPNHDWTISTRGIVGTVCLGDSLPLRTLVNPVSITCSVSATELSDCLSSYQLFCLRVLSFISWLLLFSQIFQLLSPHSFRSCIHRTNYLHSFFSLCWSKSMLSSCSSSSLGTPLPDWKVDNPGFLSRDYITFILQNVLPRNIIHRVHAQNFSLQKRLFTCLESCSIFNKILFYAS